MIPGLGGDAAAFICYGHAVQSSKHPELFGKGTVEGVLAPESANNSKEGGALIPTLAFGVPGSSGMAILLGAFTILGVQPGPEMLTKHIDLVFSMVWVLVFANVIGVLMCLVFVGHLAKITFIRISIVIPFILVFGILGSFLTTNHMGDVIITLIMGGIGYAMKVFDYPRAPLILGIVLGEIAENTLHLSLNLYGPAFLLRPITLLLLIIIIASALYPTIKRRMKMKKNEGEK
jgi:TctA family transporter